MCADKLHRALHMCVQACANTLDREMHACARVCRCFAQRDARVCWRFAQRVAHVCACMCWHFAHRVAPVCAHTAAVAPCWCGYVGAVTPLTAGVWDGLTRPAWGWGRGGWRGGGQQGCRDGGAARGWEGQKGVGVPASPLTLVTQTTSEYFHVMHKQVKNSLIQTQRANRKGPGQAPPLPRPLPPARPRSRPPLVAAAGRCRHGPAGRPGMGRAPRCQGSPPRAGVPGGAAWGQRLVLSWETGPQLYQMPLDRPPGGARIRAEARFGTWSSI